MLDPAPVDEVVNETEPDEVTEVLEEDGDVVTGGAGVDDVLVDDWVLVEEVSESEGVEDVVLLGVVVDEGEGVVEMTGGEDVEELELCATDDDEDDADAFCETDDEDEDDVEADEEDKISLVLDAVVVVVATVLLGVGRVVRLTVEDEEGVPIPEKFARVGVAVGGLRERRFEHTLLSTREKLWVSS